MASMNISLPNQMKDWIDEHVQSDHYANASEYVRDLIQRDNAQKESLRQALIAGEQSGEPRPFHREAFLRRMHKTHTR